MKNIAVRAKNKREGVSASLTKAAIRAKLKADGIKLTVFKDVTTKHLDGLEAAFGKGFDETAKQLDAETARLKEEKRKAREKRKEERRIKKEQRDAWWYIDEIDGVENGPYTRKQLRVWFHEGHFGKYDEFYRQFDKEEGRTKHLISVLRLASTKKKCYIPLMKVAKRPHTEYKDNGAGRVSDFRKSYGFLLAGYNPDRGAIVIIWEVIIMIRKLAIAMIATIAKDAFLQITLALALVVVSLVLQARFSPFERSSVVGEDGAIGRGSDILNTVETISLMCLVFTQIVSILYLYIDSGQAPDWMSTFGVEVAITVTLIILNAVVVITLITLFMWSKLAGEHYSACERHRFRCKKSQIDVLKRMFQKEAIKDALPEGWEVKLDKKGKMFYSNRETKEKTWFRPEREEEKSESSDDENDSEFQSEANPLHKKKKQDA
jgi:hypothetical protein